MSITFNQFEKEVYGLVHKPNDSTKAYIDQAENDLNLSKSIQPKVDQAKASLISIGQKCQEIDQQRADLGIKDTFLEDEVISLSKLNEAMNEYFEKETQKASEKLASLQELKKSSSSLVQVTKRNTESLGKTKVNAFSPEGLDWVEVSKLPALEFNEKLAKKFPNEREIVLFYEQVRESLGGIDSNFGLYKKCVEALETKKNAITLKDEYLKQLKEKFQFSSDGQSSLFKYLEYPKALFEEAEKVDAGDLNAFGKLKALGAVLHKGVEKHHQLLTIDIYFRLRLYREYSDYIDLHYASNEDLQDPRFEIDKTWLKLEIANAFRLGDFFWIRSEEEDSLDEEKISDPYIKANYGSFASLESIVEKALSILPQNLAIQIDQLYVRELMKVLHQENLIIETKMKKRGSSRVKERGNLKLLFDDTFGISSTSKRFFEVSNKKDHFEKLNQAITHFIQKNQEHFNLKEVKGILDKEMPFFKTRLSLFKKQVFQRYKGGEKQIEIKNSIYYFLREIEETQSDVFSQGMICNSNLLGYVTNTIYPQQLLKEIQDKISSFDKQVNYLLSKLPIGVKVEEPLIEKLKKIASYFQENDQEIIDQIQGRLSSSKQEIAADTLSSLKALDRIRDYFKEYARSSLSSKYKESQKELALLKERLLTEDQSIHNREKLLESISISECKLSKLNQKSAEFGVSVYELYRLIYQNKYPKSLARVLQDVFSADPKEADFEVVDISLIESLPISSSLKKDIQQFFLTLKTDLAIRNHFALLDAREAYREAQFNNRLKNTFQKYELLTKESQKESKREEHLQRLSQILQEALYVTIQKQFVLKKVSNLSKLLKKNDEFDPRTVPLNHQNAFYSSKSLNNPQMDIWKDLNKIKNELKEAVFEKVNTSEKTFYPLKNEALKKGVEQALIILGKEKEFFERGKTNHLISNNALIFNSMEGNPFKEFGTQTLTDGICYAYSVLKHYLVKNKESLKLPEIIKALNLKNKVESSYEKTQQEIEEKEKSIAPLRAKYLSLRIEKDQKIRLNKFLEMLKTKVELLEEASELEIKYQYLLKASKNREIKKDSATQAQLEHFTQKYSFSLEEKQKEIYELSSKINQWLKLLEIDSSGLKLKKIIKKVQNEISSLKDEEVIVKETALLKAQMQTIKSEHARLMKSYLPLKKQFEEAHNVLEPCSENRVDERALETAFQIFGIS